MIRLNALDPTAAKWVLGAAVLTALPLLFHLDPLVAVAAAIPLLWQAVRLYRHRSHTPVNRILLILLTGIAAAVTIWRYGSLFGRVAGLALLAMLLGLKLVESRSQRDAHIAVQLCFFLQLGYFLVEQNGLTAVFAFSACGLALAALQRIEQPALALRPAMRGSLRLLLIATPLALVLFILFPRIERPLWGLPADAQAATTGLSDSMAPGSIAALSQSNEIAFRADFTGPVPDRHERYFRGPVLSDFDGLTWRPSRGGSIRLSANQLPAPNLRYTLTLEPHQQQWLLGLEHAIPGQDQSIDNNGVLRSIRPINNRLRTTIQIHLSSGVWQYSTPGDLRRNLALPAGFNPRTLALGKQIAEANPTPSARLSAALDVLRHNQFVYTLTPPVLGRDTADEFLFQTRQGFCEHFAGSFVILMRAAGVSAHVVTGYQGGEVNPIDGSLVVRQSDAHAWAEVWVPEKGWLRIDPTAIAAPRRIDAGITAALASNANLPFLVRTDSAWLRALRDRGEALSHAWNTWVLGYNFDRQRNLMRYLGLDPRNWQILIALLIGFAAVWQLAVWLLPQWRHRPVSATDRAWRRLQNHLAKRGFTQGLSEGALSFIERVGLARSEWSVSLHALAERYIHLKYARPMPNHAAQTLELERAIKEWISKN
ncbi:MAG: DUF3488 and transglutaminase-like domain-containing protein [Betaproteobacteria bacterium]|nr:DUF3488 and transglutaminase-like domain-containing protein [Betaproteobacteria bacterium]